MRLNDFVYLDEAVPGLMVDARYATTNNLTGHVVEGYLAPRAVGSRALAQALAAAQRAAREQDLTLLVWDAYRPQRAVNCLLNWAAAPEDQLTKSVYYPRIHKADLVPLGYIAPQSAHSRGSAVDLTLANARSGRPLFMGGVFDLMDPISGHDAADIPQVARRNRVRLKTLMERFGFLPYQAEWWHYTLKDEPYPNTYFDFPIDEPPLLP